MNPFNPLNPQGPPCPADHPLSFSETLLYVSQVAFLALAGYIALLGPHQGRAYLSGRVSRVTSIPPARMQALTNDLDVWITTQLDKNDANIVKSAILQGVQTGENFTLNISYLRISSLPPCLARLKLTELNCSNCPLLAALPALPSCTELNCSNCPLAALPELPNCTELKCYQCPLLTALPALPSCTALDCLGCPLLTALPALPSCTALDCHGCLLLTALPELPSCTSLDCSDCPLLAALPELPSCTALDCHGCLLLTALPALPSCTTLYCYGCPLAALPVLPSCTTLYCYGCPLLAALPVLPSCTTLYCYGCPLLAAIPALPSCAALNCSMCPLLAALPALLNCTSLYCSGCPLLTALPHLPICTDLRCFNCPLTALPALPSCFYLDCDSCPLLAALPALPNCTILNCSECPLLTALPAMPPNAFINSHGCPLLNLEARVFPASHLNTCPIYWKTLNEEPLKVLKTLLPYLKRGFFPNIVFLNQDGTPQEGSDAGGLRRTLMSELFAQLSKLGCIPKNPGTELLRPTAAADAEEKEILEALGLLFVSAADRNLPIGQIFDLPFFTDLQAFSGQNLAEYTEDPPAWIKKQCSENSSPMAKLIRECQTLELLKQTFSEYPIPPELDLEGAKLFVLNACLEETVKERSPWYEAAYLIASAMKGRMGSRWETSCALSPEAFQGSIEGAFSKKAFAAAILWQGREDAPTKAFLLKWIDTQDVENVKELLQFSTGSRSLTEEPVRVMISLTAEGETVRLPTSHTCVRQLCLPTGCSSQQMFDAKIKHSLDDAKATGFLFA